MTVYSLIQYINSTRSIHSIRPLPLIRPTRHHTRANAHILLPLPPILHNALASPKHRPIAIRDRPRPRRALKVPLVDGVIVPTAPAHAVRETRASHGLEDNVRDTRGALRGLQDGEFVEVRDEMGWVGGAGRLFPG